MANVTSLIVKIGARDQEIQDALAKLGSNAKKTSADLSKLGDSIDAQKAKSAFSEMQKGLKGLTDAQQKLANQARDTARGLEAIGGISRLTDRELAQVNRTIQGGLSAYKALGQEAPAQLQRVADAIKDRLDTPMQGLSTRIVAIGTAIGSFLGNLAYDAVKRLGSALIDIAQRGVQMAPVAAAFQRLAASVGETGAAMLTVTRTATRGLISDLDLMQASNKALLLGLPVTSRELGLLGQTAVVLGKAMGQGAAKSMDDLIVALGRSSPMILDNLGLTVKVGEANEKYAKSVGKTSEQLTDAEKKLAFYNAAMDVAKKKVEDLGGIQLTLADRFQQVKVAIGNFTDALGVAIAVSPELNAGFGVIGDALSTAFGSNQTVLVQKLTAAIGKIAIVSADVASVGVSASRLLLTAWSVATSDILSQVALLFTTVASEARRLAAVFALLSTVPGAAGAAFGEAAKKLAGLSKGADEMAVSALKMKVATADAGKALDGLDRTLDQVRERMRAVAGQQVDSADIAGRLGSRLTDLGKTGGLTAEQLKKMAEETKQHFRQLWDSVDRGGSVLAHIGTVIRGDFANAMQEAADTAEFMTKHFRQLWDSVGRGGNVLGNIGQVFGKVEVEIKKVGGKIKGVVDGLLGGLNDIFQRAFEGGGGVGGAIKSFATSAVSAITKFIPVVGPVISKFSGAIVAGFSKIFGGIFGDPEKKKVDEMRQKWIDAAGGWDAINKMAQTAGVTLDRVLSARTVKDYEKAVKDLEKQYEAVNVAAEKYGLTFKNLADPGRRLSAVQGQLAGLVETFRNLTRAGFDTNTVLGRMSGDFIAALRDASDAGVLDTFIQQLVDAGRLTEEMGQALLGLVANAGPNYRELTQLASEYGITLEQLGPAFQQAQISETAKKYADAFKKLVDAGADVNGVMLGMQDEVQALLDDAFKFGSAIPNALRPLLEQMVASGLLTDATGTKLTDLSGITFADSPLEEGIDNLTEAIEALIAALGGVPTALGDIANANIPTIHIPVEYDYHNQPSFGAHAGGVVTARGVQRFAGGGRVLPFLRRGADTVPAMLTPGEIVLNAEQQGAVSEAMGGTIVSAATKRLEWLIAEGNARAARAEAELPKLIGRHVRDAVQTARVRR